MSPITATTTAAALPHVDAGPAAQLAATDQPQYRPIGGGKFAPANQAAIEEFRRFNAWADEVNARTSRGLRQ